MNRVKVKEALSTAFDTSRTKEIGRTIGKQKATLYLEFHMYSEYILNNNGVSNLLQKIFSTDTLKRAFLITNLQRHFINFKVIKFLRTVSYFTIIPLLN